MPDAIFYSWQSDVSQNKSIIRAALDRAISELRREDQVNESDRNLIIDQDTQGLSGSPSIADAILTKISDAFAFVADVTFVAEENGRHHPNPNVMIEYGYALAALGDSRIVAVMNEEYGPAEKLPFDLVHKRWPIRFRFREGGTNRNEVVDTLKRDLKRAISAVISQHGPSTNMNSSAPDFLPAAAADQIGLLRGFDEALCIRRNGDEVRLKGGPYSFLRVIPTSAPPVMGHVEALNLAQSGLRPMDRGFSGASSGRHETGAVSFLSSNPDPLLANCASELFLTGEIWGVDTYYLDSSARSPDEGPAKYIPTKALEAVFKDTLRGFVEFARTSLNLSLPLKIKMGCVGIRSYVLAVNPQRFWEKYQGPILQDTVLFETEVTDWSANLDVLLAPFFRSIYDAAGASRPEAG